jgi:hypothetical protein
MDMMDWEECASIIINLDNVLVYEILKAFSKLFWSFSGKFKPKYFPPKTIENLTISKKSQIMTAISKYKKNIK